MRIQYIDHASFILIEKEIIYLDPYKIPSKLTQKSNFILISHDHFDHFNIEDIKKISNNKTTLIIPEYMKNFKEKILEKTTIQEKNIILISTHETIEFKNINVSTIPAYNTNKNFHNKNQGVGYIIDYKNNKKLTIYFAGDTDYTPEMKLLSKIDYALIPFGEIYTLDKEEIIEFIKDIKPKYIIPMHYGNNLGLNLKFNLKEIIEKTKEYKTKIKLLKPQEFIDFFY